jgi:UDP-N-acetylglucosamine 2-epimerase (non-hydrolysing)
VLVARDSTERTEGVEAGTLRVVGTDTERIATEAALLLDDPVAHAAMARAANPYGDGRAAGRIIAALEQVLHGGAPPSPFGPGYSRDAVLSAAGYRAALLPHDDPAPRGTEHPSEPEHQWPTR